MAYTDPRLPRCYFRVSRTDSSDHQHQSVKPRDFFDFKVTANLRFLSTDSNAHHRITNITSLFEASLLISCERFFANTHDFLLRCLPVQWHMIFNLECLNLLADNIIPQVQRLFHHNLPSDPGLAKPSDSHRQVFSLVLDIVLDVPEDEDLESVVEESMQDVRMIPTSKEAIQTSLKNSKVAKQKECCTICMEEFDVNCDDDSIPEVSAMPCGHQFHKHCIVRWLQISHVCPLCRYPMPTVNN